MKELKLGRTMGVWVAFLLTLVVGCSLAAPPPAPTATKRSDENIQFGNQQNKPVSVLDEDALPGAFPSSETLENGGETSKSPMDLDAAEEDHTSKDEDENQRLDAPLSPSPEEEEEVEEDEDEEEVKHHLQSLPQHTDHYHPPLHREEMVRDLPPVALASRWRPPSQFYNQHWNMDMSPVYGGIGGGLGDGTFPVRRRRRSTERRSRNSPDPKKIVQVSLHALRTGHRHKRDVRELTRIRRDLGNNVDLDKLLREVDVVELLTMLAKPHPHRNNGYATVTYAPLAPAPPRFAPQPKLFPDFDEEEEEEEDDGEGAGYLRQGVRPPQVAPETFKHPTVWRRSDVSKYGLSRVPGFKRSAFRANTPAPPIRALNPGDVYSLAAMLGAELDPVSHRVRRVAM